MPEYASDIVGDKLMAPSYGLFTSDDIDSRMLYKEFQQGVTLYNEVEWGLLSKFVRETTKESVRVFQRNMEFVTAAEGYLETWQKIRATEILLPLEDFELGFAFTKKGIQDATAGELKETHSEALRADQRLMAKRFFKTALSPGSGAASRSLGSVGWWDANMAVATLAAPPKWKGNSFTVTHDHFDVSGAAALALSDFNALKKDIREHGYTGPLMLFMHTDQVEECENLAGWTTAMTPVSIIETVATMGFDAVKQFQGFTIVIDDWMPSGYLLGVESKIRPITMRNPLNKSAKGLKLWEGPYSAYPLQEAYYGHRFDMAVCHRGAGAVRQITADASYTTPTFTF
ncbi:hypothetical protein LCGC14_0497510 [marine sediment metagenome]|uniref:Capsid protein n=1 Tax=marine sediment metagenome TaxID=412755 RepID=A0A0F9VDL4_9ZZZZ